eukprot:2148466-Prymnesium_polylepis.1
MKHTSQGRVVCGPHWTLRNARVGCYSARASTRRNETAAGSPTPPRVLHRVDGDAGREDAHL